MTTARRWTDYDVARIIGTVLRVGVLAAGAVTAAGGLVYLWRHGGKPADYGTFIGQPEELRTIGGVVRGAAGLHGRAIIQLGLLLLVATPIARVALSLVGFTEERDWRYVGITAVVLGLLLFSLLGRHG